MVLRYESGSATTASRDQEGFYEMLSGEKGSDLPKTP